ncbi:MAG: hypothetical protein IPH05_05710 [Flavobacteriales bacterium]|jgi:hypothetical protein|nr:hypothetical protein [Flavobacteriales bacterium]MBK6550875.1 hypothetical protein [Flavobacteriales bacterium]MBK6882430.1 hypothetical protein [Flavobacteriales bacterium]MBK7101356.1 hypothetical protein [Flavobacteriales bacterium]MBK7112064.1 hypothetical protein [Flavobacteriales bacterium]
MIKFFRQFRQCMIKENRVSQYLLYAIGEIVLVVIGILIALQINTWNEGRKSQALVMVRLSELVQDLELDRWHFDYHLRLAEAENHRIDSIRTLLSDGSADQEVLMRMIKNGSGFLTRLQWVMIATTEFPQLHQKTLLSLQNSGQLAIFDHELQESIGSFYGFHQKYSFMIEEIMKEKNIVHADFVRSVPYDPNPEASKLNAVLVEQLWSKVDEAEAGRSYITLLNTFHELNTKTIFFNSMRLGKTKIMIDEMNAVLHSVDGVEEDQKEASEL